MNWNENVKTFKNAKVRRENFQKAKVGRETSNVKRQTLLSIRNSPECLLALLTPAFKLGM